MIWGYHYFRKHPYVVAWWRSLIQSSALIDSTQASPITDFVGLIPVPSFSSSCPKAMQINVCPFLPGKESHSKTVDVQVHVQVSHVTYKAKRAPLISQIVPSCCLENGRILDDLQDCTWTKAQTAHEGGRSR